jgi:hypothetical protein
VLGYLLFLKLRGAPHLTILDLPRYLRRIDAVAFTTDLNPLYDMALDATFSRRSFRRLQRERLYRMRENLCCMAHDAFIFIRLANTALWLETKERPGMEDSEIYIGLAKDLHVAAVEFRTYTLLTLLRINFWLALRTHWWFPMRSPEIAILSQVAGFSFQSSYSRFKAAVAALCKRYDEEFLEEIVPLIE